MTELDYQPVLAQYATWYQPRRVEALGSSGGFSGASLWRLHTPAGSFCLRAWPTEHPLPERLEFIQAVLWHVGQQGFRLVPVPVESLRNTGYVESQGRLWELTPWMPGVASYHAAPSADKLVAAMEALAAFHQAAEGFPLPDSTLQPVPGLADRHRQLARLRSGEFAAIRAAVDDRFGAAIMHHARDVLSAYEQRSAEVARLVEQGCEIEAAIQPCSRDIWADHVLFEGDEVSGMIDFGALRPDHVATDVARLARSLAGDNWADWDAAVLAYERIRPWSASERTLLLAFDRSSMLLAGINWLGWLWVEGRSFDNMGQVQQRLARIVDQLASWRGY